MLIRLQGTYHSYPRQFWLMFLGMTISAVGASMIWPFLTIYISEKLDVPAATAAWLIPISALVGVLASFIAGPITDRVGRKGVMVVSLAVNGVVYILMLGAHTFAAFAAIQILNGIFNPLYRVGSDAMVSDLIPPEQRSEAYALLRMSNNIGVAIGPAAGGILAGISYNIAFYCAAGGLLGYGVLIALFARETLANRGGSLRQVVEALRGYRQVLSDRAFTPFVLSFAVSQVCAVMVWILLGAYVKSNYNVPESLYGVMATTNALMVICFQVLVTMVTKRFNPLKAMAVGAVFYALATGGVALGRGFWGFWACMVVMTIGELILAPTSSTYTANLAPADMRGRYMSIFGMTWGISSLIVPMLGNGLGRISPQSPWIGGLALGLLSAAWFVALARRKPLGPDQTFRLRNDDRPRSET